MKKLLAFLAIILLFPSLQGQEKGTFIDDRDGKTYKWIKIGNQTWMAENLNYMTKTDSWCYGNKKRNCNIYGRLYYWEAALLVCPTGWHVPKDVEWTTLEVYLGGFRAAGRKMKETGTTHWISPNTGATNESGFFALPGGYRFSNGTFNSIGSNGNWWSSTEYSAASAYSHNLHYNDADVGRDDASKNFGLSVRCVRDE